MRRALLGLVACACAFQPDGVPLRDGAAEDGPGLDGAIVDARREDAPVLDARTFDARTFDARTPDARTPDARTFDARTFDARTPDARTPDAAPPAAVCSAGTPGLVACWDFESSGSDGTGHGHDATLENVTFGAGRRWMGLVTSAASQSRAFVAASTGFNVTGAVTLEAWFRPTLVPAAGQQRVGLFDTDGQWGLFVYAPGDNPGGMVRCSITGGSTFYGGTITAGTAYHVACTYDSATGSSFLYLNGVQVATASIVAGSPIVPSGLSSAIASDAVCPTAPCANTLTGTIDEVRVWSYVRATTDLGAP